MADERTEFCENNWGAWDIDVLHVVQLLDPIFCHSADYLSDSSDSGQYA